MPHTLVPEIDCQGGTLDWERRTLSSFPTTKRLAQATWCLLIALEFLQLAPTLLLK